MIISHFDHPSSLDAAEMFVLRAESKLWAEVLQDKVGDQDMFEPPELLYARGMHPQYERQLHLVASDASPPSSEDDVVGVATLEFPMSDNPRLVTVSIVVRESRRGEGIGSALHEAALNAARKNGRSTVQAWTHEPLGIPDGAKELAAETDTGSVWADSPESRFLSGQGYVLGQVERISRLSLPTWDEVRHRRDEMLNQKPRDYEVITLGHDIPARLFDGVAALSAAMASDAPTGTLDLEDEVWDAARMRAQMESVEAADREQILTLIRHIPTAQLVGFTRIFRDRSVLEVAHQWETLVMQGHRGHGLGMLMKVVNLAAAVEFWPEVRRLITGNASENRHMLAINDALGFEPYAASGFWELRLRGSDG